MKSVVQRLDLLARVAAPFHARDVQAVTARVITDRERKGQGIFDDDGVAADVGFAPDAAELVHAGIRADVRAVRDLHVPGQRRAVSHNHTIAEDAIMRDVGLGHDQAIVARLRDDPPALRAAMNGDEFAYAIAPADARLGGLSLVFQVL